METKTITVELSENQYNKFEVLKEKGIGIGEAIDMLFNLQEELESQNNEYFDNKVKEASIKKEELESELSKVNKELDVLGRLKDTSLDYEQKQEILEKEYATIDESYEMEVQARKHQFSWLKNFKI